MTWIWCPIIWFKFFWPRKYYSRLFQKCTLKITLCTCGVDIVCGFGSNPCETVWPHRIVIWLAALSSVCSVRASLPLLWHETNCYDGSVEAMMTWGVPKLSICWVVWVTQLFGCEFRQTGLKTPLTGRYSYSYRGSPPTVKTNMSTSDPLRTGRGLYL